MGNFAENLILGNRFRPPLYKICWRNAPSIFNFDMIVIHIGILIYPVKGLAKSGLIFSQHIKKKWGGGPQIN